MTYDETFVAAVAANPNTSPDTLTRLGDGDDGFARRGTGANPNLRVRALAGRAVDPDSWVRYVAAANPNLPAPARNRLADEPTPSVRGAVAANPNTSEDVLNMLAGDKFLLVQAAVAGNANTPPELFAQLAESDDWVLGGAAANLARRLADPAHVRGEDTSAYVDAWLALSPDVTSEFPDLYVAAVCAVTDDARRGELQRDYGPDWQTALAAFKQKYGNLADTAPARTVHTRRRGASPRESAAPSTQAR